MDPVPDPILPEKFLGYSRESNPGHLGWQSDVLTTIPNCLPNNMLSKEVFSSYTRLCTDFIRRNQYCILTMAQLYPEVIHILYKKIISLLNESVQN